MKGGAALESLARVTTVVLDKTGTITEGRPRVSSVTAFAGVTEREVIMVAASVERSSEHPLARAIVAAADERGILLKPATDVVAHPGQGVEGWSAVSACSWARLHGSPVWAFRFPRAMTMRRRSLSWRWMTVCSVRSSFVMRHEPAAHLPWRHFDPWASSL